MEVNKLMFNRKIYFLCLPLLIMSILLSACQQPENTLPHHESLSNPFDNPDETKHTENLNIVQNIPRDAVPDLEGGPETDTRKPHPVSNSKLQLLYPHLLFLSGNREENKVALTFDDGPDVRYTPKVLDVLKKHNVKATFFLIGSRAKEHDDIVKRIHDEGHAIGNHTFWHPNLPKEELDRLHWEVSETEKVIDNIVGFKPRLFRSPYGALTEEMVKMLGDMNNTIIGWDVDTLDWKQLNADEIADNALSNVQFGSIILMHDGGDWSMDLSTPEAVDDIITKLKEDNTEFVTIPELIDLPEKK